LILDIRTSGTKIGQPESRIQDQETRIKIITFTILMKTALVAGSTGLIGSQLLEILLNSDRYSVVKAATRSDLSISHPKLVQIKIDYSQLESYASELQADDVFCCLGTTMAKARSREKFREVDFEFPLRLARITTGLGAKQFLVVSALGADKKSSIYYNRVKGELEEAISGLKFEAIHIFRPSLLLGPRAEARPGEDAAKLFYRIFWFLLPDKYKAIDSQKVAAAMLHYATREQHGVFIHESREMQRLMEHKSMSLPTAS
jgi:uncharacterized protein YbjT (DUF2867 family)